MDDEDVSLILTHYSEDYSKHYGAIVPPVYMNSLNVFPTIEAYYSADPVHDQNVYTYGRVSNPTVVITENKIAKLEHGNWAALFASGMAATSAGIFSCCKKDSKVVCLYNAYGPVKQFFSTLGQRYGIRVEYVKGTSLEEYESAITDDTSLVMLESPSSAIFTLQDIKGVCKLAHAKGARVLIDNTYCTPIFQNPLDLGVDLVMHTASKYLGGHSDLISGVLVGKDEGLRDEIMKTERELIGGIISPVEAWLIMRGMRTLQIRMKRHFETAMAMADFLEKDNRIKAVHYPGLISHPQYALAKKQQRGSCGLMSIELDADVNTALRFIDGLKIFKIGVSWGGFESLACMPYLHETDQNIKKLGGGRGLIRLHCGLEDKGALIEDLRQSLSKL